MSNGQWQFDTREGKTFGPFQNEMEAKKALALLIAQSYCNLDSSELRKLDIRYGVQEGIDHMIEELVSFFYERNKFGQTAAMAWAHRRIMGLVDNGIKISDNKERKEAIEYALDQE